MEHAANNFRLPLLSQSQIEGTNSIITILLIYMAVFILLFLWSSWNDELQHFRGPNGWVRAGLRMYRRQKAAIAILTMIVGFVLRYIPLLYARHVPTLIHPPISREVAVASHLLGTALVVIGIACWIRLMSPFRYTNTVWVVMLGLAYGFAVAMTGDWMFWSKFL